MFNNRYSIVKYAVTSALLVLPGSEVLAAKIPVGVGFWMGKPSTAHSQLGALTLALYDLGVKSQTKRPSTAKALAPGPADLSVCGVKVRGFVKSWRADNGDEEHTQAIKVIVEQPKTTTLTVSAYVSKKKTKEKSGDIKETEEKNVKVKSEDADPERLWSTVRTSCTTVISQHQGAAKVSLQAK